MASFVKIGSVVLEEKIFRICQWVFSQFRYYLPLEKGGVLHLKKVESPSPKDSLCQVWLKRAQCFRKMKIWKVYDNANNNDGQCKNFDQTTSLESSAQVSLKLHKIPKSSNVNLVINTLYHSCKMSQKEAHGPHCSSEKPVQINEHIWAKYIYSKMAQ